MTELKEIRVPDLGTEDAVPVAEIFVKPGDDIKKEEPLMALESDKAVMEIPSPFDALIKEIKVKEGDMVKTGDLLALAEAATETTPGETVKKDPPAAPAPSAAQSPAAPPATKPGPAAVQPPAATPPPAAAATPVKEQPRQDSSKKTNHASPSVRHFARELGADLSQIKGSGPKGRIKKEDVQEYIKKALENPSASSALPPLPQSDPSLFGPVELQELTKIQKISASRLHASWVNIPHVTHYDDADITNLEVWRHELNGKGVHGVKFSALAFVVKALYKAVEEFPRFNAVMDSQNGSLIIRKYYNIGIAVETPQGLLVPVIKNVDQKNLTEIVRDISDLATRGKAGKLGLPDLQGAGISISNLGGIGGKGFTPIINPPEVAILGMSRSSLQPVWENGKFVPKMMLPLSLSYDHRAIDGALAARFTRYLADLLEDMKKILL